MAEVLLNYHDAAALAKDATGNSVMFPAMIGSSQLEPSSLSLKERRNLAIATWKALIVNTELPAAVTSWEERWLSWLPWRLTKPNLAAEHQ